MEPPDYSLLEGIASAMNPRPTLYILDAYSIIYQVYHAIPTMTGPSGQPTNAVFGIFRDLLNLLRTKKPDAIAAAFDGEGPVFRSEIYIDYKANRSKMPDDLIGQIPVIRRVFEGFRIPVLTVEGAEADDVIATLATQAVARSMNVLICTSDKDARQLINDHVSIYNIRKQKRMDAEGLFEEWGVRPDQVVDLLSLTGDSVDNVPGVPGIGLKTATGLLQEFGTLDQLLEQLGRVSGPKRRQNLRDHAEDARRARTLIELRSDLPLNIEWDELNVAGIDHQALKALCIESGFHRFLEEIDGADPGRSETSWPLENYQLINTSERFEKFLQALRLQPKFSFDTETTALNPLQADLVGLGFCWKEGEAYYLPLRGPEGATVLDQDQTLQALRPILGDPKRTIVGQNLKYDLLVLDRLGIQLSPKLRDTMVLSYLLESGERNHSINELSRRFLDHTMIPISDLIGQGKKQSTIDTVDLAKVTAYAGEDADAAWRLEELLGSQLESEGLLELYEAVECPLIPLLAGMESSGIKVDVGILKKLSLEFGERLKLIQSEIYELAGREFNIASAPQLRQVLFDELGLKPTKKTPKGEPSTDAEVLETLAASHPLPRLIVDYRQLDKLKGTYLDSLPELVHDDGRIHASFNQVVAATGRLSSSDPNLQNIPIRTEDGRQIREAFIPGEPGWALLTADYSQIELRILGHYCQDPALVRAFAEDRDIHAVVASEIFSVPEAEVSPAQRRVAKTVNFGVIYGLSPFGLASRLGIPQSEASTFIDAYFKEYAGVSLFITKTLEDAKERGFVQTILGRRRRINGIVNTTGQVRNLAERTAVNTVIQGSAADLIKRAMLEIDYQLKESPMGGKMLLQIHDELVFESPESEINALATLVQDAMTNALPLDVPLKVDLAAGPNWRETVPLQI